MKYHVFKFELEITKIIVFNNILFYYSKLYYSNDSNDHSNDRKLSLGKLIFF